MRYLVQHKTKESVIFVWDADHNTFGKAVAKARALNSKHAKGTCVHRVIDTEKDKAVFHIGSLKKKGEMQ